MTKLSLSLFLLFAFNITKGLSQSMPDTAKPYGKTYIKPEFKGGTDSLNAYIIKNLRYPDVARESSIEGLVKVAFLINEDGSMSKIKVIRGIGGGCDEEALRVVKTMPDWAPARYKGRATRAMEVVGVVFKLE